MRHDWKASVPPVVVLTGAVLGVLGAVLMKLGNPPNMGLCIACFERDIVGALGLHRAAVVQRIRPEIPGLVLGVVVAAAAGKELRGRSAAAPALSFVLGAFVMIGALVFLGCPIRMTLRLAGGDLNALTGLAGFAAGIWAGTELLKRGFTLGRSVRAGLAPAIVMPCLAVGLLVLAVVKPPFIFASAKGPGSMTAPLLVATGAGILLGVLAQRSRLCFAGGARDILLIRSPHLLVGFLAALVAALVTNLILGQFHPGFANPPIGHTDVVWNFLGMALVGLGAVLLGGCPLRQLVLASQGDGGAVAAVAGMFAGAAFAHNFSLAASPAGVPVGGKVAVAAGLVICLVVGWSLRER
jgi:YedE family putative selenium metabolism protein